MPKIFSIIKILLTCVMWWIYFYHYFGNICYIVLNQIYSEIFIIGSSGLETDTDYQKKMQTRLITMRSQPNCF